MKEMRITTPQQRLAVRREGERRAAMSLVQILCAMSILRTALTRIVPAAGAASWWVTLLCLLPGLALCLLGLLGCRMAGVGTLAEMARRALGRTGAWLLCGLLGGLLLLDGVAGMTALVTLFTQGVGARGTQLTMALLTGGAILCCLHREGLPRGAHLLRWALLAGAVVAAAVQLPHLRADHLLPFGGSGAYAVGQALRAGFMLGWPLLLLLTIPQGEGRTRLAGAIPVLAGAAAVLLLLCLSLPHELLSQARPLAGSLLLTAQYASSALRLLVCCLLLLGFFFAIAGAVQLSADMLCAPLQRRPRWLAWAVLMAAVGSQALDVPTLWRMLGDVTPWLLLVLAGVISACVITLMFRRERT